MGVDLLRNGDPEQCLHVSWPTLDRLCQALIQQGVLDDRAPALAPGGDAAERQRRLRARGTGPQQVAAYKLRSPDGWQLGVQECQLLRAALLQVAQEQQDLAGDAGELAQLLAGAEQLQVW